MKRAWLEVDSKGTGRTERYCLQGFERVVIGRGTGATLRMAGSGYAREHAGMSFLHGRWQVADLGSPGGTYINDTRILTARRLDSGDVFWMNGSERFRFVEELLDPRKEAHAHRVAVGDDSDAAWLVFSDALQELGDEAGRRMMTAGADPALPLGFLERMRSDGTVSFSCRYGFVRRLAIRNAGLALELEEKVVRAVLSQPVVRLVRELELDITSFEELPLELLAAEVRRAAPPSLGLVRLLGVFGAPPRQLFPPTMRVEWAPI